MSKSLIFALIAAGVSGIIGEGIEKGLNAADQKWQERKAKEKETEDEEDEKTD